MITVVESIPALSLTTLEFKISTTIIELLITNINNTPVLSLRNLTYRLINK